MSVILFPFSVAPWYGNLCQPIDCNKYRSLPDICEAGVYMQPKSVVFQAPLADLFRLGVQHR